MRSLILLLAGVVVVAAGSADAGPFRRSAGPAAAVNAATPLPVRFTVKVAD